MKKAVILAIIAAAVLIAAYPLYIKMAWAAPPADQTGQPTEGKDPQEIIRLEMAKDLQKKQDELNRREELLNARETQLKFLEQDIQKKIEELQRVQQKLEELVKIRDDLEAKNVANLTKAYSTMAPQEAAVRLKAMDRSIALKILMAMKTKNSSKILSSLDPETAAQFTEQLAKRQME